MTLASNKLKNNTLELPKIIKENFKKFDIDENTIFEWDIKNDQIIITPRQKVTLDDVVGIVKDDDDGDWDIDELVYGI